MKQKMMLICNVPILGCLLFTLFIVTPSFAGTTPPASPVKLIFIHHSTGGNWLADPNDDQPHGSLGAELMDNNYYVSATNYGWGFEQIGDRTDIPNWPEWFAGLNSSTVMTDLFNETGQNIDQFGAWPRLSTDPGGENTIIMIKSCYPNSDLFGEPTDPPASEINEQFTVANAKAVYNLLLATFAQNRNKLFIIITAPPQNENDYAQDYQTAAHRAANARAFNNWLVHEWLLNYPHKNVAVFDYFNVLTGENNHHRWNGEAVEHVIGTDNNMSAYALDVWDSHPDNDGHQKATQEFVPLLNHYYNQWNGTDPVPAFPVADIKLNGSDGALSINVTQSLNLSVALTPNGYAGNEGDWWLIHIAPGNQINSLDAGSMMFKSGLTPVIQTPMFELPSTPLGQLSDLLPGQQMFCFGVDLTQNGVPDSELYYDCILVDVSE